MKEHNNFSDLNWASIAASITKDGYVVLPPILSSVECKHIATWYEEEERFRSRIVMQRYAFGRGEYKYFKYPLPDPVQSLRTDLYQYLAPIANQWHEYMKNPVRFPTEHADYLAACHSAGQLRPTPLMLKYGDNDYTCLHQDLYGDLVFPFQAVFLLSKPNVDFEGGEFIITETDPKSPGRAHVVPIDQGQVVIFAVNSRPVKSQRGHYRVNLRHGVSKVHRGSRQTMGIIFHDAK
jgi:hypothetical protein